MAGDAGSADRRDVGAVLQQIANRVLRCVPKPIATHQHLVIDLSDCNFDLALGPVLWCGVTSAEPYCDCEDDTGAEAGSPAEAGEPAAA